MRRIVFFSRLLISPASGFVDREADECAQWALEQINDELGVGSRPICGNEADDENENNFVDFVGDVQGKDGADSDGFTYADALMWEKWLTGTIAGGVVDVPNASEMHTSEIHTCWSCFFNYVWFFHIGLFCG